MHPQLPQPTQQLAHCIAACRTELLRGARQLVGLTDAEDLIQSTFERALQHAGRFEPESNLLAWLRRIMSNLTIDTWRRQDRHPMHMLDEDREYPALGSDVPEPWEELTAADVRAAAALLPKRFREVFELHNEFGLSYTEIAQRLQIPLGTVGTRLLRARSRLRASLIETLSEQTVAQPRPAQIALAAGRLPKGACANDQLAATAPAQPARPSRRAPRTSSGPRTPAVHGSVSGNA
jgi:RNA polymerase sigma-70 factor (ECF subfamily)